MLENIDFTSSAARSSLSPRGPYLNPALYVLLLNNFSYLEIKCVILTHLTQLNAIGRSLRPSLPVRLPDGVGLPELPLSKVLWRC